MTYDVPNIFGNQKQFAISRVIYIASMYNDHGILGAKQLSAIVWHCLHQLGRAKICFGDYWVVLRCLVAYLETFTITNWILIEVWV